MQNCVYVRVDIPLRRVLYSHHRQKEFHNPKMTKKKKKGKDTLEESLIVPSSK